MIARMLDPDEMQKENRKINGSHSLEWEWLFHHEKFPRPHKCTEMSHEIRTFNTEYFLLNKTKHPSCALNKFAQTKSGRLQLLNHNGPSTSNSEGRLSK